MSLQERAKEIRDLIKAAKNPFVLYDCDTDGTMSYFILRNSFKKIRGFPLANDVSTQEIALSYIKEKHDLIICIDTPILSEKLLDGIKEKKIVWVDHHLGNSETLIEKYSLIHMNPLSYNSKDSSPSCYLAYLISNKDKTNLWRVSLGSVIDFYLLDVLLDLEKEFPFQFKMLFSISNKSKKELLSFIENNDFLDSSLKESRAHWIRFLTYECKIYVFKHFIDLLFKIKKVEEISQYIDFLFSLSPEELKVEIETGAGISQEVKEVLKSYDKILKRELKQNQDSRYIFIYHTGKISFNRQLCEELSYRFSRSDVILSCFEDLEKERFGCSVRSKTTNVQKIVVSAIKGLNGKGGGHENSAGVSVSREDFPKFKKRFEKQLKF